MDIWDQIRERKDCVFVTTTKRPERIAKCVPQDWGLGWPHVHISTSVENQERADKRLPALLAAPLRHREVFCSPLIGPIVLDEYLKTGLLKCVNVGGEMAPYDSVRTTQWRWVYNLYREAKYYGIEFYFHQTGNALERGGSNIGAWDLKTQIYLAEKVQHELETIPVSGPGYVPPISGVENIPKYITIFDALKCSDTETQAVISQLASEQKVELTAYVKTPLSELLKEN